MLRDFSDSDFSQLIEDIRNSENNGDVIEAIRAHPYTDQYQFTCWRIHNTETYFFIEWLKGITVHGQEMKDLWIATDPWNTLTMKDKSHWETRYQNFLRDYPIIFETAKDEFIADLTAARLLRED